MTIAHGLKLLGYAAIILIASTIPSQAQTADEFDEIDCNKTTTQLEINICAGREAKESDRQLNLAYQEVLNIYKTSDMPAQYRTLQQDTLLTAQLAWIKYRDTNCRWQASKFDGGSIQPAIYASCISRMSKDRSQELLQSIED